MREKRSPGILGIGSGPKSPVANESKWADAGLVRLRQLEAVSHRYLDELFGSFSQATGLPKLEYHFRIHGEDLGAQPRMTI